MDYNEYTMKKTISIIIFFIVLALSLPVFYLISNSQSITLPEKEEVVYDLPYPGMLPDNPLHIFKDMRDGIFEFFTRDNLKKAELLLLYSDKRVRAAELLVGKGKSALAAETLLEAEKNSLKIPPLLAETKKQGATAPGTFLLKLKQSNVKHRQVIEKLLQQSPQGEQDRFDEIVKINKEVTKQFSKL